jgi:hypothetical protein
MSLIDGIGTCSGIVCLDQVHFVVRDSKEKSSYSLLENIALTLKGDEESMTFFDRIKYKNESLLKRPEKLPATDSEGYLKTNNTFLRQLKNVIGSIMDSDSTSQSTTALFQLHNRIQRSIDIVNSWSAHLRPEEQSFLQPDVNGSLHMESTHSNDFVDNNTETTTAVSEAMEFDDGEEEIKDVEKVNHIYKL